MFAQQLTRTFNETIYYQYQGPLNEWEIDIECHGSLDAPDQTVGYKPLPQILGLEVTGMRVNGEEIKTPHLLDWMDSIVSNGFWYETLFSENELENLVLKQL